MNKLQCNQIVKQDDVDMLLYDIYTKDDKEIELLEKHKKNPTQDKAIRDIYNALFKLRVETETPTNKFQECLGNLFKTPEFEQLRINTSLDVNSSMIGTVSIGNQFFEYLPDDVVEEEKLRQQIQKLQEIQPSQKNPKKQKEIQDAINRKNNKMQQLHESNENVNTTDHQSIVSNTMNVLQAHKEFENILGNNCGNTSGKREITPDITNRIEKYNILANNKIMKQIAKNVGDMQVILDSWNRKKINKIPDEIVSVECGNNLRTILPGQKNLLVMPETEMMFYKKYVDRSLLQYKRTGIERSGEGPIFYVEDISGSMHGDSAAWSRAIGFTLMKIAIAERRKFYLLQFENKVHFKEYDHTELTDNVMLDYVSTISDGGTDYDRVLSTICEKINDIKTDVIFTTDAEINTVNSSILENLKNKKQQYNFNVYGILIGNQSENIMKPFCNKIHRLNKDSLMNEEILEDIFSI